MPALPRQTRLIEPHLVAPFVRPIALGMFGFYLLWNALWIASGKVPVSILTGLTGIPCPTTGCTRSIIALFHAQWLQAFLWNTFTLVYVILLAYSGSVLATQFVRRKRLVLKPFVAHLWMVSLAAGWVVKIILGPKYW